MVVKQYVKNFENLGFGMFVHFGLYSMLGTGEWSKHSLNVSDVEYEVKDENGEGVMKPWYEMTEADMDAVMAATTWNPADNLVLGLHQDVTVKKVHHLRQHTK